MQALSFAVRIPLVAFGISLPAMVLFVEWLGQRRSDELYLTLASRRSKVMLTLFAVGVITGTVMILFPSLAVLFRLTVAGRFRAAEPIGRHEAL
jgi:cytochrome bd-type quinol oxidase subunit 1